MRIPMPRARSAWLALWALLYLARTDAAESTSTAASLTLAQAIDRTLEHSPSVAAFATQTEAAARRAEAEALPPGFVIESEFENFAGTGNVSGVRSLESTVRLSRVLELGGKQALRQQIGSAELDRLAATHHIGRLDASAEAARRFIQVLADQEQLAAAERAIELAKTSRDVVQQRVESGASSPVALSVAEIALTRARLSQQQAQHQLEVSRVKLSTLWGDPNPAFEKAQGDLFVLPELEPFEAYRARLDAGPDLARFATEARVQDARIRLAEARRMPDISVAAGVRRLEPLDDQALVASFSVPLGTKRRADLERSAIRAERAQADLDKRARELEMHAALFDLYRELQNARMETDTVRSKIQPQAAAMLRTIDEGYRVGRFSQVELAQALTQLLEIERDAVRAAATYHTLLVEVARLTGTPMHSLLSGRSL